MIVDCHNHVGVRVGQSQTGEQLITMMDRIGVEKAVIFPFIEQPDNDYIAEQVKKYPDRLIGFACVNPWNKGSLEEVKRSFSELNLKGLKLHPFLHGYGMDNLNLLSPFFKVCEKYGRPVLSHGSGDNPFSMPLQFEEIAKAYPDVTLIMAHAGFIWATEQARRVAKRCPNIYLDMTGATMIDMRDAVEELGAERVLMGSDTPFQDIEVELVKARIAVEDEEKRALVTGGNILRILGQN